MPKNLVQATAFLFGFWFALWLSPLSVQATEDTSRAAFAELERGLLEEINRIRSERNLIPLTRSAELDAVARAHSLDMARRSYLAHESPEGRNPLHRLEAGHVVGFTLAAENIGSTDRPNPNREIVTHWIQSPIHRQNLYSPPFNTTGIGIARSASGALIYTQLYVTYPRGSD
jgi:uncharacterized protein YkwD